MELGYTATHRQAECVGGTAMGELDSQVAIVTGAGLTVAEVTERRLARMLRH